MTLSQRTIAHENPETEPDPPAYTANSQDDDEDFDFSNTTNAQADDDKFILAEWDGPARPGAWSDWMSRKVDNGDKWWDPVHGSARIGDIPSNFSPGMSPPILIADLAMIIETEDEMDIDEL